MLKALGSGTASFDTGGVRPMNCLQVVSMLRGPLGSAGQRSNRTCFRTTVALGSILAGIGLAIGGFGLPRYRAVNHHLRSVAQSTEGEGSPSNHGSYDACGQRAEQPTMSVLCLAAGLNRPTTHQGGWRAAPSGR